MSEINIIRQRRIDFEKTFGPFSLWALLPFKKLSEFWDILVQTATFLWPPILKPFDKIVKNINKYIMKYVQGLFPL